MTNEKTGTAEAADVALNSRRAEAICLSPMHRDAKRILYLAEELDAAVQKFLDKYDADETSEIFKAASCYRPEDDTADRGATACWSEYVHHDMVGLGWALGCYVASAWGHLYHDDQDDADGCEPTAVVAVEGGAS
jgi:hypothetical protein